MNDLPRTTRRRRSNVLATGPIPVVSRRPSRTRDGVGSQADIRYCPACGAKKKNGQCIRECGT